MELYHQPNEYLRRPSQAPLSLDVFAAIIQESSHLSTAPPSSRQLNPAQLTSPALSNYFTYPVLQNTYTLINSKWLPLFSAWEFPQPPP